MSRSCARRWRGFFFPPSYADLAPTALILLEQRENILCFSEGRDDYIGWGCAAVPYLQACKFSGLDLELAMIGQTGRVPDVTGVVSFLRTTFENAA